MRPSNEPGHDKRRNGYPAHKENESHVVERLVNFPEISEETKWSQAVAHEREDVNLADDPPQWNQFRISVQFLQEFVLRD